MFDELVLDLSHWNGDVNFRELKKNGVYGVILKCGGAENGKFYMDPMFLKNYNLAKENGLHVGCYWFTGIQFKPEEESKQFHTWIKGMCFDLPIYLDFECSGPQFKRENTEWCIKFIQNLYKLGHYFVGIYASDISGFRDRLNAVKLLDYTWWVARYGNAPSYAKMNMHMHQYTSAGRVKGVKGNVDCNHCYRDFPTVIISGHYNGY